MKNITFVEQYRYSSIRRDNFQFIRQLRAHNISYRDSKIHDLVSRENASWSHNNF